MSTNSASMSRLRVAILLLLVITFAIACSGATTLSAVGNGAGGSRSGDAVAAPAGAPPSIARDATLSGVAPPSDLLVVKTGSLALQVKTLDEALSAASTTVASHGGYISGSQRSGDGDKATASATYRIPAAAWDVTLTSLRGLAGKVLSEQTQTEEVTGQVIDLGARITNLEATETALQAIMAKAIKISDVLAVQEQLTQVRGEVEQLTAQKKHLEEQAAYGTLTATYSLQPAAAVTAAQKGYDPAMEIDHAVASLVGIGQALASAGIWFAIVWLPVLVALAIIGLIAFIIGRRVRRYWRRGESSAIAPVAEA